MACSVEDTIAVSSTPLKFCWSSHLPAWWYIFFMLFVHFCSKEDLLHNYLSIPIVFIWSPRHSDCNIPLIITHYCSNFPIENIESMSLFSIRDLTHWAAWGYLMLILTQKYYLPDRGDCSVVCNSTGAIGSILFNGVKPVVVDVAWAL